VKEERDEGKGKAGTDEWALPSSDTSKKKGKGVWLLGCWGRLGCWAGAAIGLATGFWKAGLVEVQSLGEKVLD
jgi:hypothetical protein